MEPEIIFGQKVPGIIYQGLPESEDIFILKVEPDPDENLDSNVKQKLPVQTPPVYQRESMNNELKKQITSKFREILPKSLIECRTCLEEKNQHHAMNISHVLFNFTVTIKEMLILCIPIMALTLKDEDFICNTCLEELKLCYYFVDKCLKVEETLKSFEETIEIVIEQDSDRDSLSPDNVNEISIEESDHSKIEDAKPDIQNAKTDLVKHSKRLQPEEKVDDIKNHQKKDDIKSEVDKNVKETRDVKSAQNDDLSQKNVNLNCEICHKHLSSKYKLTKHLMFHEKKRKSFKQCPVCSEKLSGIKHLQKHLTRNHKGIKLYSCEKCNQKFLTSPNLTRHQAYYVDTSNCQFECKQCKKVFKSRDGYKKHLEEIKDAPGCNFLQCVKCSIKFTKDDFREHVKIHPNVTCVECGKSFTDKQALCSHKIVHRNPNTYICQICAKGSKTLRAHRDHLRIHEQQEREKPFACTKCPKKFTHLCKLKVHERKQHENIRNFHCTECDKKFCTQCDLNAHKKLIHAQHKYSCEICDKTFGRIDYLRRHKRHHTGEPRLDKDGKEITRQRMPSRMPSVSFKFSKNELNKTCICKYCKKKIIVKNLLNHYQVHLRIRKFKCNFCELIFTNYPAKHKHEKLHSDPNYKFRCKICFKKQTSQEELEAHMATHTKKPYECNICSEPFGRMYLLENHKVTAHQNDEEMQNKSEELFKALEDVTFLEES